MKAFTSLLFLLLFLSISLFFFQNDLKQEKQSLDSLSFFFEAENASFQRSIIEKNIDFILNETIQKELKQKNIDSIKIKKKLIEKINSFFSEIKNEGIYFDQLNEKKIKLVIFALNENIFFGFFSVAENVNGFLFKPKIKQQIMLPKNYEMQVIVFV